MDKNTVVAGGKTMAGKVGALDIDPNCVVTEMARAYREYHVVREEQRTKRREIDARQSVALAEIEGRRQLFLDYLTRSFDERADNFAALFARVDVALKKGDTQALAGLVKAITDLAQSSPFKDLANLDVTRRALKDPGHEWEI